jgi:hypothetical protein
MPNIVLEAGAEEGASKLLHVTAVTFWSEDPT